MENKLIPIAVKIGMGEEYQRLLVPGKDTINIKSGCVTLGASSSVGEHNTDEREEVLFILAGEAEILCDGRSIKAGEGEMFYIPPRTRHDVKNVGNGLLRYIFLVVPVRPGA